MPVCFEFVKGLLVDSNLNLSVPLCAAGVLGNS